MEEKQQEINNYFSAIGYDLADKESHLNLLASTDERYYYRFLVRTIPNIDNISIISICNIAMLLATIKKLNSFMNMCDSNIELYLKLLSKRNESVVKVNDLLKIMGFTGATKDKLVITYSESEGQEI